MSGPRRRTERRAWLLVFAGFALSRLFYDWVGLDLDDSGLGYFWQVLDLDALRADPLRSIYYQHTQPPLFNAYLAAALHTPEPRLFLHLGSLGFGLALHGGLYMLAVRVGVRRWLAIALVWAFAFYPASILMELWVFYTYPVAAMLVLAGGLLSYALAGRHVRSRPALFAALFVMALVVLTRSLFHLAWLVLIVVGLLAFVSRRRQTLAIALLPLLLASSLYAKNWVEFDRPVASTWLGFSLSRLLTTWMPRERLYALQRQGELSPLASTMPWWPLYYYPREYRQLPTDTPDVAVLRRPRTSTLATNYNHAAYLEISRTFQRDAQRVFEDDPSIWYRAARYSWWISLNPIHQYGFFAQSRGRAREELRAVERFYEAVMGSDEWVPWNWGYPPIQPRQGVGWRYANALLLALLFALYVARREPGPRVALLYCVFTVAVVALIGNSVELGENQRFRFLCEPLAWLVLTFALERMLRALAVVLGPPLRRLRARAWS